MPTRGAKLLYLVGASVFGIPGSPGYTKPFGAVGYCTDCRPGTSATILFWVSYHGVLNSHRTPKFRVRLERILNESCAKSPPYRLLPSRTCGLFCAYDDGAPRDRKSTR